MGALARTSAGAWLLLALLGTSAAATGPAPVPLREYFQETWTTADGLPHNLVADIAQTPEGYLWFGTWEGAVRYNGHRFDVFDETVIPGMPDRGVTELDVDRSGRLLVGTARGGMARRERDGWTIISTKLDLASPSIYAFLNTDTGVLAGTAGDGVLVVSDEGEVRRGAGNFLDGAIVYSLLTGTDGRTWFGTNQGLYWQRGNQRVRVGNDDGLLDGAVLSMLAQPGGDILLGTERGAFVLHEDVATPLAAELPPVSIESLLRDRRGDLWIGTASNGLYRLGQQGLEHLDRTGGLPNNRVAALFEDKEGSIWVGTNTGLMRLRQAPFRSLTRRDGLPDDYVRAVVEADDGALWVGTSGGLARIPAGRMQAEAVEGELAGASILSLAKDGEGGLWVGTYFSGLLQWRDGQVQARLGRDTGLPSNQIRAVATDGHGVVWAGTTSGLVRIEAGQVQAFGIADGLPDINVLSLYPDRDGRVWIGTGQGLAVVEQGRIQPVQAAALAEVQRIYGFNQDAEGTLWMATDRGLARLQQGRWSRLGSDRGLPVSSIFSTQIDADGHFWLSSNRGVVHVDGVQMREALDGKRPRVAAELLGEGDGMASAQCNGASGPSALVDRSGAIWFGTAGGVSRIDPGALTGFPRLLPAVVLEQARVDGEFRPVDEALHVPADARRVELQFVGLSYQTPGRIHYRYRLEGYDPDWVDSGRIRIAQFTSLPPGEYRFRGSAASSNGEWSPHEAVITLVVEPHWWQRWPVQLLGLGLLVALVVLLPRARMRQLAERSRRLHAQIDAATADLQRQTADLQERNRELDAYAHTVAHDLKTPLTTVLGLARLLQQARDRLGAEQVGSSLDRMYALSAKMAAIIDALLLLSRTRGDQTIELKPVDSRPLIEDVLQRIDEMRTHTGAMIFLPPELPRVMAVAEWLEEVWVNYLSNAIKYGGAPPRISIGGERLEGGRVRLWVQDAGPGIPVEAQAALFLPFSRIAEIGGEGHGLGLSIVRRIVERMGGRVGCDSQPGQGARFWVELAAVDTGPG